jgi:hypothetical protein
MIQLNEEFARMQKLAGLIVENEMPTSEYQISYPTDEYPVPVFKYNVEKSMEFLRNLQSKESDSYPSKSEEEWEELKNKISNSIMIRKASDKEIEQSLAETLEDSYFNPDDMEDPDYMD